MADAPFSNQNHHSLRLIEATGATRTMRKVGFYGLSEVTFQLLVEPQEEHFGDLVAVHELTSASVRNTRLLQRSLQAV